MKRLLDCSDAELSQDGRHVACMFESPRFIGVGEKSDPRSQNPAGNAESVEIFALSARQFHLDGFHSKRAQLGGSDQRPERRRDAERTAVMERRGVSNLRQVGPVNGKHCVHWQFAGAGQSVEQCHFHGASRHVGLAKPGIVAETQYITGVLKRTVPQRPSQARS